MSFAEFDPPERFVVGTVGPPGQRTFFLQARGGGRLVSVSLEKVQVNVLADRIVDLLEAVGESASDVPPVETDNDPLDAPIEDSFRVTTMALSWDVDRELVVIECHDRDPDEDDERADPSVVPDGEPQTVRVVLSPVAARAFARRAAAVVAAGRPPCPFCGQPLDPDGHICPRANGYRR